MEERQSGSSAGENISKKTLQKSVAELIEAVVKMFAITTVNTGIRQMRKVCVTYQEAEGNVRWTGCNDEVKFREERENGRI